MDGTKKFRALRGLSLWIVVGITIFVALFAGSAHAEVPVSDGFDYPVGNRDNFDGWHTSLYLGGSWTDKNGQAYLGHLGEDYLKNSGSSKDEMVYSVSNGIVYKIYTSSPNSWGGVVIIKHVSPTWNKFSLTGTTLPDSGETSTDVVYSLYGHLNLDEIYVHENDIVSRGTPIGKIGVVPAFPTPHLHFEIKSQKAIDTEWQSGVGHGYSGTNNVAFNHYKTSKFIASNRPQITPLIGDWNGDSIDDTSTYNPRTSTFSLSNGVKLQFGEQGDIPITGDWNDDNIDTIGVYRPKTAEFFLDYDNDKKPDKKTTFGEIGDFPIVGDWDGDGDDNLGIFRSFDTTRKKTMFFLDSDNNGATDTSVSFGNPADIPIVGDWDTNGVDDIGIFRKNDPNSKNNAAFYLDVGHTGGAAESGPHPYGRNDDIPIVGKWDKDGLTKIGVYRLSTSRFHFNHDVLLKSGGPTIDNPPVLASIGDKSVYEQKKLSFTISAKDPDGDKVTYSAEGLPSGAKLTSSGLFTWTPGSDTAGNYIVNFIATANGQTDSETITITVNKVADNPPVLASIGDKSVYEKEKLSFSISAKDPDGDKVTYSAEGLPSGSRLSSSGLFSWTPGLGTAGKYTVKFIATANGQTDSETITITVNNPSSTLPEITSITPSKTAAGTFDLTIKGKNFNSKTAVEMIYFDGRYVGQGTIKSRSSTKIVVTEKMTGATPGVYVVTVRNNPSDSSTESNGKELTVTAVPVTLSISPTSGKQGTTFRFSGNGYTPYGEIEWHVRKPDSTEFPVATLTASSSGTLSYTYKSNSGSMIGTYIIWAVDKATGRISNEVKEKIK